MYAFRCSCGRKWESKSIQEAQCLMCGLFADGITKDDLVELAKNSSSKKTQKATIDKLIDPLLIADVAKNARFRDARKLAIAKLTDQKILADIAKTDSDRKVCMAAIKKINNENALIEIAKKHNSKDVRLLAISKIKDEKSLFCIIKNEKNKNINFVIVEKIESKELLEQIAQDVSDKEIRDSVNAKLMQKKIKNEIDNKAKHHRSILNFIQVCSIQILFLLGLFLAFKGYIKDHLHIFLVLNIAFFMGFVRWCFDRGWQNEVILCPDCKKRSCECDPEDFW